MKTILSVLLMAVIGLLSGCSGIEAVKIKGTEINDGALDNAVFIVCRGASVGAVRRRFDTLEEAETWRELCQENGEFTPNN